MVERLRKPETLLVLAVVCLVSAVGNGLYEDDFANVATIVCSVATSRNRRPPRSEPDPARDRA